MSKLLFVRCAVQLLRVARAHNQACFGRVGGGKRLQRHGAGQAAQWLGGAEGVVVRRPEFERGPHGLHEVHPALLHGHVPRDAGLHAHVVCVFGGLRVVL